MQLADSLSYFRGLAATLRAGLLADGQLREGGDEIPKAVKGRMLAVRLATKRCCHGLRPKYHSTLSSNAQLMHGQTTH